MTGRMVVLLVALGASALGLGAETGMVSLQLEFNQAKVGAETMARCREMVSEIEGSLLDRLFEGGHIGYNTPAEIHLKGAQSPVSSLAQLKDIAFAGGGNFLVRIQVAMNEVDPQKPPLIESLGYELHALGSSGAPARRFELSAPAGLEGLAFQQAMNRVVRQVVSAIEDMAEAGGGF